MSNPFDFSKFGHGFYQLVRQLEAKQAEAAALEAAKLEALKKPCADCKEKFLPQKAHFQRCPSCSAKKLGLKLCACGKLYRPLKPEFPMCVVCHKLTKATIVRVSIPVQKIAPPPSNDQQFRERLTSFFTSGQLFPGPDGATLRSRQGTQTIFVLERGSITIHIPKTAAELALEAAAKLEADKQRRVSEAHAKQQRQAAALDKQSKAAAKKDKNNKSSGKQQKRAA